MKDSKRKIAVIIPGGIGTGTNNIGVPVLENVIRLMSADFNVTVFQLYPTNKNYCAVGFELIDIYSANRIIKGLKFLWTFWRIQRKKKFKVVHGFWAMPCGFLAVLAGRVFRLKSIISLQGGDAISIPEINYGQLQSSTARKLGLWALHQADELTTPSNYLIHNLRKSGLTRTNIHYIPLGVDISFFAFQNRPLQHPIQFLHIATLSPVKDQVTLLKAFLIISSRVLCHLTIIGGGPLERNLKALSEELKVKERISFLGLLPYASLPAHYHRADILLHTSLSEGHPIVLEEAMSCGVLACGTNVGLFFDLPEYCVSVPVGDYESLAAETLKVISDPARMETIKKKAHEWARTHSIDWTVARIRELYSYSL